jgi:hypothetical protein
MPEVGSQKTAELPYAHSGTFLTSASVHSLLAPVWTALAFPNGGWELEVGSLPEEYKNILTTDPTALNPTSHLFLLSADAAWAIVVYLKQAFY